MAKVFIASDHAGYSLKEAIMNDLVLKGIQAEDLGPDSEDSVDYPDYAKKLGEKTRLEEGLGILVCGTGIGMSISANKIKGVRAALCFNTTMAKYARAHNDANVLCMGSRVIGSEVAKDIVRVFLNTEFEFGRHKRRIEKIEAIQEGKKDSTGDLEQLQNDITNIANRIEDLELGDE